MASNIPTAFSQRKKALNLFRWTNKRYRGILIAYILLLSVSSPLMELIIKLKNRNIEEVVNAAPVLIGTTFTLVAMIFLQSLPLCHFHTYITKDVWICLVAFL